MPDSTTSQVAIPSRFIFLKNFILKKNVLGKLKSGGIYLLVPVINFGISFITSPIFARYLSAEDYGYYGYYSTLASFLLVFSSLSLQTYYMSVFFKETEEKRRTIQTTLSIFTLVWNLVFFPIAYLSIYLYLKYSHSQIPFFPFALLALLTSVLGIFKGFVQVNYRLGNQPVRYLFIVAGYRVLGILMSLYFVIGAHMGLQGRMLGVFVVEIAFFAISLYSILSKQQIRLDKATLKPAIRKILPLIPASFLFWPLMSFDNIVVEKLNQPAQMGLYNIGKGIANYLFIALQSLFQAFEPDIYKYASTYNLKGLKKTALSILVIVVAATLVFTVGSPYLIHYLTAGRFTEAIKYSNIFAVTYALIIIYSLLDAMILAWQDTKINLAINIVGASLSIITYILGARYYQQTGVAAATVATHLVLITLLILFISRKFKNHRLAQA
ncbi:oligosaccharide flippase family protein [Mucilaginibacter sp. Bleaf8]|uniref:lipopolysaccharide biosynthesis protein n=1 Tax=Mucilaginibacter sp. Bleaf8 TaxID=2834430 RepID=UPI001BD07A15|nr:oligosaccharide flippase family protein [Mucilaginibacter sp. Bleaf8]MBS7566821.1 oligosaccharide flippase family protein [Mucilaginibacter sp. Bleaf8]